MLKRREFLEAFGRLGKELTGQEVTHELFKVVQRFVSFLYGFSQNEEVNAGRAQSYFLPPCHDNLQFHIMRSNFIGYLIRHADKPFMDIDDPTNHGLDEQIKVVCSSVYYPSDTSEVFFTYRVMTTLKVVMTLLMTMGNCLHLTMI